jgi:hypothetical protein
VVKTQTLQRVNVNLNDVNLSDLKAFTKQSQAVDKWRVVYMQFEAVFIYDLFCNHILVNTGLFEMIVGVLKTCRTQYT